MHLLYRQIIIFLLSFFVLPAGQAQFPQWNRLSLFGGNAYDNVSAVRTDLYGNYYIAGQIQDVFGPGATDFTGNCQSLHPLREDDVDGFVFRYDSSYTLTLKFAARQSLLHGNG